MAAAQGEFSTSTFPISARFDLCARRPAVPRSRLAHQGTLHRYGGFHRSRLRPHASVGFHFAPRTRDLGDTKLFIPKGDIAYDALKPMISSGRLNIKAIRAHWDEVLRLATSIKQGTMTCLADIEEARQLPVAQQRQDRCGQIQAATSAPCGLSVRFFRFLKRPLLAPSPRVETGSQALRHFDSGFEAIERQNPDSPFKRSRQKMAPPAPKSLPCHRVIPGSHRVGTLPRWFGCRTPQTPVAGSATASKAASCRCGARAIAGRG